MQLYNQNSDCNDMRHYSRYCGPPQIRFNAKNICRGIKTYFGDWNIIYTHKGKTAIKLALEILNLKENSKILFPSYFCGSEIDPILKSGIKPVLYRVDLNCNMDIEDVYAKIDKQTSAIFITHYFGFPQNQDKINELRSNTNLALIEDCAHSLFGMVNGKAIGSIGDAAIYSFKKVLALPDGGALVLRDRYKNNVLMNRTSMRRIYRDTFTILKPYLLRKLTEYKLYQNFMYKMRSYKNDGKLHDNNIPSNYYWNQKMEKKKISKLSQILMERIDFDDIVKRRRSNYQLMFNALKYEKKIRILYKELEKGISPLCFPILVENRDKVAISLGEKSIDAIWWWKGYHKDVTITDFPEAQYLKNNIIALPIHQDISDNDVDYIVDNLKKTLT
jgi:perosamine synthetase